MKVFLLLCVSAGIGVLSGCGLVTTADTSAGGVAAGSVGGILGGSAQGNTQASFSDRPTGFEVFKNIFRDWLEPRQAFAVTACPTLASSAASGCGQTTPSLVTLTYDECRFGTSLASWSGLLDVQVSSGTLACGTFPQATLTRQFVATAGGAASTGTRTSAAGLEVEIDHSTADLGNYQGDSISTLINSGYGTRVTWTGSGDSAVRTGIVIKQRLVSTAFDMSVSGSLTVDETAGAGYRKVSGTMVTYHNLVRVKGTLTFTDVRYEDTCCTPTSGSISTVLASTSQSGVAGIALNGLTESMTFLSCGTARFTNTSGTTSYVSLAHCY